MAAIVGVNVTWGDHYNRGDAAALTAMDAPDAVVMMREGDATGTEAIRRHFERLFTTRRDTVLASNVSTEALDVAADRAYEAGTVTYSLASRRNPGATRREVRVRYITFWQMTPEGRRLIRRSLRSE
ncbi:MAG: YybH family protein [Candidatus Rokuibacteriota bacterium]